MSFPPPPTHPLTLPSSILTIPDPRIGSSKLPKPSSTSTNTNTPTTSSPTENPAYEPIEPIGLRIKITPHILIPTPLISPAVTGRKVEGCVDVMVPLGGRVELGIHVGERSGERVVGCQAGFEAVVLVEEEVRNLVRGCISKNAGTLSLVSAGSSITSASSLSPTEKHAEKPSTTVTLIPRSSSAPESSRLGPLVPTGHPIAYLTRLDLSFTWAQAASRAAQRKPSAATENGVISESQASNQTSGVQESQEDDMQLLLEDDYAHEWGRCGEALDEEEMIIIDDCDDENTGQSSVTHDSLGRLPGWARHQLDEGLKKIFRVHMIRRFPLIFDFGLLDATPRGILSALNRFLTLSSEHNTPFLKSSRRHLKAIVREQESQLKDKVAQAIELPTNKRKIKELAQKKRKIQAELKAADKSQKKNAATSPEFEKMEQETELVSLEVTDNQERARAYLAELKKRFEDNVEGAKRADEARLTRILGEATGRIGRERWEELRRGMGKLAWWKVQLLGVDYSPIVESAYPVGDLDPRDDELQSISTLQTQTQARRTTGSGQAPLFGGSTDYDWPQLSIPDPREALDDEDEENDFDDNQILDDDDDPCENESRHEDEDNEVNNEEDLLLEDDDEMDKPIAPSLDFGLGGARGCEEWPDRGEEEIMMLEDDLNESDDDATCSIPLFREADAACVSPWRSTGLPLGCNGDVVHVKSDGNLKLIPTHELLEAHIWDATPNAVQFVAAGTAIIRSEQDRIGLHPNGNGRPFVPASIDSQAYWGDNSPVSGRYNNCAAIQVHCSVGLDDFIDSGAPGNHHLPPSSPAISTSHWSTQASPTDHTEVYSAWRALDDFDDEDR